jgi:triosephosphate isomerase
MSVTRPFFGGNWKMHKGPTATHGFVESFAELYPAREDRTVAFFPPAVSLTAFREAAADRPDLRLGAQDVHWEREGAFTGAISTAMARDAGAEFALAGHSERRHVFGDSDEDVGRKVRAIAAEGLIPVLCVGELLEERERDEVEAVVGRQLEAGLQALDDQAFDSLVIAYEPVWAIGTGRTARPEDASAVHTLIRGRLEARVGDGPGGDVPIIYGGSVKPNNIDELLAAPEVDGVLVGSASLDPESFAAICRSE